MPHASTLPRRGGTSTSALPPTSSDSSSSGGGGSSSGSSTNNRLRLPPSTAPLPLLLQPPSPQTTRRRFPAPLPAPTTATRRGSPPIQRPPPVASRPEQTKSIVSWIHDCCSTLSPLGAIAPKTKPLKSARTRQFPSFWARSPFCYAHHNVFGVSQFPLTSPSQRSNTDSSLGRGSISFQWQRCPP